MLLLHRIFELNMNKNLVQNKDISCITLIRLENGDIAWLTTKLKVGYNSGGVWLRPWRRILWSAAASTLHQDVVLSREGDGSKRNHQKQVWHIRLHTLAVDQVALFRAEMRWKSIRFFLKYRHIYVPHIDSFDDVDGCLNIRNWFWTYSQVS